MSGLLIIPLIMAVEMQLICSRKHEDSGDKPTQNNLPLQPPASGINC